MKWATADLNQKLIIFLISVKEQRVDGSSTFSVVRYTLVAGKPVLVRKSNTRLKLS